MKSISLQRQRDEIARLRRLIAERLQAEQAVQHTSAARNETATAQRAQQRERLARRFEDDKKKLNRRHTEALAEVTRAFEIKIEKAAFEHDRGYRETVAWFEKNTAQLQAEQQLAGAKMVQQYDALVRSAAADLHDIKDQLEVRREAIRELGATVHKLVRRRRCRRSAGQLPEPDLPFSNQPPLERFTEQLAAAHEAHAALQRQPAARFLGSGGLLVIFIFACISATLSGLAFEALSWPWVIAGGAISAGLVALIYVSIRPLVVRQTLEGYQQIRRHLTIADAALDAARTLAMAEADKKRAHYRRQRDLKLQQYEAAHASRLSQIQEQRQRRLQEAADQLQSLRQAEIEDRNRKHQAINDSFEKERQQLTAAYQNRAQVSDDRFQAEMASSQDSHQRSWSRVVSRWHDGLTEFEQYLTRVHTFCQRQFPAWEETDWNVWTPPEQDLPVARFGEFAVRLDLFEGGLPESEDLQLENSRFRMPALTDFGEKPLLMWQAWDEGRQAANRSMRHVMLRLFTGLPPGKVRFTIIDPVGLGQNFSAFMHLADLDEQLVNHRIWTEPSQIEQRLANLTEHMEDIIQTYLRNEFATIDQYNREAGDVAEPFQILAIANFPSGFSEEAAARLLSIVQSGARCGVFTLLSTDSHVELPRNFRMAELEALAVALQWTGTEFRWQDDALRDLPLQLDNPPSDAVFTRVLREYGRRAREAYRVEVPFATVAPPREQWWTRNSDQGVEVELGRAGATKLQRLRLGHGTSQHVLVSGKTGSGKSTLLHVLITNTALHYPPQEVEFYLIDFKKGVEFKPYAQYRLPHARVVAIESEREFGMSVLERLDAELKRRGDLFRSHGVQDLRGFRQSVPQAVLPRVLLIIDEFQEFFVQDDRIAQDAALLLDRLVRQGRAFGIHVLLGSQTLAGAYSLARSTIGQMAVRIALQCSEADSHLILSEDNNAARLLSRPGEAIYNDANGLFEGNHPFQVVWLGADDQQEYLRQLEQESQRRAPAFPPAVVFEGNVAAQLVDNAQLVAAIEAESPPPVPRCWLGAAVAIKDPTSVDLPRRSGANLLLVGQQDEMAFGVLASTLISLLATAAAPPAEASQPQFFILDGMRAEAADAGGWRRLCEQFLPARTRCIAPEACGDAIGSLFHELQERGMGVRDTTPRFLLIYDLARFRSLRRADDDFGFSVAEDAELSTAGQLVTLLREGPSHGIHTLLWCDTYANLNRWFDRTTMRELDHRVLFQMSATDSSNLMDSPAASRLGLHRALLYSEERGTAEKFRPYGPPSSSWLQEIARRRRGEQAAEK